MVPIPMGDDGEREAMRSGPRSDRGGNRGVDTDASPTIASTSEAIERQLTAALDAAESSQTQFHLRQALQLVKALDE
ncbi:hypothetical protein [Haloplanus rubicundus]|nr:hypothetical protein [Haloplanus rubicundus]